VPIAVVIVPYAIDDISDAHNQPAIRLDELVFDLVGYDAVVICLAATVV
jgi:hypothetical protein